MPAVTSGIEHVGINDSKVGAKPQSVTASLPRDIVGPLIVVSCAVIGRNFSGCQEPGNADVRSPGEHRICVCQNVEDADLFMEIGSVGKKTQVGVVVSHVAKSHSVHHSGAEYMVVMTTQSPGFEI